MSLGHYYQTLFTPEMCPCGRARLLLEKVVENTHAIVWRKCALCFLEEDE